MINRGRGGPEIQRTDGIDISNSLITFEAHCREVVISPFRYFTESVSFSIVILKPGCALESPEELFKNNE